jgi:hypothetical protein
LRPTPSIRDLHPWLVSAAGNAGLLALDELSAYGDVRSSEVSEPDDVWHPNVRGHQLTGLWLAAELSRRGLVPTAR